MTKGEGLVAFLYAIKDMINAFAIMIITGVAVLSFFYLIFVFIANKVGWLKSSSGPFGGGTVKSKNILYAVFILFVIFAVYSLIGLTAAIFGVNSSPSGGLLVR
jgi:hypothetical protein